MSFEGREILTQKCAGVLDELRPDFVRFCSDLTRKCGRYVDEDKIEDVADSVYGALLAGEFNRKKIANELADCFSNDKIFSAYLLNAAFLRLLRKFCVRLKKTEVELLYCTAFLSYAIENFTPDYTLFLDLPPEKAFLRKGGADKNDRLEITGMDFHNKVYKGYKELAEKNKDRFIVIDASGEKAETHAKIIAALKEKGVIR